MENLRLHEDQIPDIDREWLLIESQNRELNRMLLNMESEKVSIFDAENILLNIWNHNPNTRPYILRYINTNSQNIISLFSERNASNTENNEINIDKFDNILDSISFEFLKINQMFNKNDSEWFWEIDENEKKIITNFESNTHELLASFDNLLFSETLPEDIKNQLIASINQKKQEYLKITIWIWDKFEGSAWALQNTEWLNNALSVLPWMITTMSPNEVLNYIKNIHKTIDSNNRQSDSVINNYSIFTEKLSNLAYESFKNLDSDNKKSSLYELAKMVSWRWIDIDKRYKNSQLAENILADLMNDKWWVFEKILSSEEIDIVDNKLDGTAQKIAEEFRNINIWDQNFLDLIWFADIKEINQDYSYLSPEQKIKISTLSRIKKQIKTNPELDIISALQETVTKTASELYDPLNDLLGHDWHDIIWKKSWDYWLSAIDGEIFNLYQDIAWAWLLDLSDNTIWNLQEAWKMWAMIAIAIWAWIWAWLASPFIVSWVVASAIVTWIAIWVTSVVASQAIYQNWYDTKWDATKDIWSDLLIASATWAIWWWVTAKYMSYWTKSFFSMWALKNAWLAIWDWALWMWSEYVRQQLILWKEASFADMMKLWWPMLAFWVLMWAKAPNTRAEMEIHTRNLNNWLDFANEKISYFHSELEKTDLSIEARDIILKQKIEYENLRTELSKKKYESDFLFLVENKEVTSRETFWKKNENWYYEYSKERLQLHQKIINEAKEEALWLSERMWLSDEWKNIIILMRWNSWVWKSTVLENTYNKWNIFQRIEELNLTNETWNVNWILNPDDYKTKLRSHPSHSWKLLTSNQVHQEWWEIADYILDYMFENNNSMILDQCFLDQSRLNNIMDRSLNLWYHVELFDVYTPRDIAYERIYWKIDQITGEQLWWRDPNGIDPVPPIERFEWWHQQMVNGKDTAKDEANQRWIKYWFVDNTPE